MIFTFARANAGKLIRLPFYAVAGALALLMPRQRHLWVFGRRTGVGEGPLRLLRVAQSMYPQLRLIWIAQDAPQAKEASMLGLEVHLKSSWRAYWLTLRAGVTVITHGFGDLCRPFVPGSYLVQLWHGSPLKRIHLDSPRAPTSGIGGLFERIGATLVALMFRTSARFIRCIPAPSSMVAARYSSVWGWPDDSRIKLTGDPRCDVLLEGSVAERHAQARRLLCELWRTTKLPSRMVLYAPTWRDGAADPCLPQAMEWQRIDAVLAQADTCLVVRAHPWGTTHRDTDDTTTMPRIRFLSAQDLHEINRVLNAFDVLITDYSAIAMDYSLLRRPIVFFAPDIEAYVRTRGLYENYDTFTHGRWHRDWDGVATQLSRILASQKNYAQASRASAEPLLERYHHHRDAQAAQRLLAQIARDIGLSP